MKGTCRTTLAAAALTVAGTASAVAQTTIDGLRY